MFYEPLWANASVGKVVFTTLGVHVNSDEVAVVAVLLWWVGDLVLSRVSVSMRNVYTTKKRG